MGEITKAAYCEQLKRELHLRESEAVHFTNAAARLERQGQIEMALAIRDMWRHNEVERLKLQAQINAVYW
jgi:hypothetical protein